MMKPTLTTLAWEIRVEPRQADAITLQCEAMREIYNVTLRKALATFQKIYQNARWRRFNAKIRFCFFNDVTRREGAQLSSYYAKTTAIEKANGWDVEHFIAHAAKVNQRYGKIIPETIVHELCQRAFTRFNNLRTTQDSALPLLSLELPIAVQLPGHSSLFSVSDQGLRWSNNGRDILLPFSHPNAKINLRNCTHLRFLALREKDNTLRFFILTETNAPDQHLGMHPQPITRPTTSHWLFIEK